MSQAFAIVGFASNDFVPGFVGQTVFGAGQVSAADVPIRLLLVGNKTSAGSMTANQDQSPVYTETEAETLLGAGSEMARQCYAALLIPGVSIWVAPVSDPGGTAATMTITLATTATSDGTFTYFIGGRRVDVAIASGDTATQAAVKVVAKVNANTKLQCTAGNSSGVVTLTMKNTGPRGNDIIVRQDITLKPAAMTSTLGGSGSVVTGVGQKFGSGATADDLTTVASNTFAAWYQRVALAARDATQLGVWETSMDSKGGALEGRPQHTVVSTNGALAAAQSLSGTTLNNARFQLCWMLNGESDPAELAAVFAAYRSVKEQSDPGADYDGYILPGIVGHYLDTDRPQRATQVAALQTGVTPITTDSSGAAKVVRSITTKCLNGSDPDYRTLDTGTAYVPDFIRYDIGLMWTTEYKVNNPNVADDPAPEQPDRPSGFATPKRWNQRVYQRLKEHEAGTTVASGLGQIIDVDLHLPSSAYDKVAKRIMSAIPVVPAPKQHQIGVSILQL